MKLYAVVVNNGESYEDYAEKVFGIFDTYEKATTYLKYAIGEGRKAIAEKLYAQECFDFALYNKWYGCIEEVNLNEGL